MNRRNASPGSGSKTISISVMSNSHRGRRVVEDTDEMAGLAAGGVGNLVTAARAVGGEQCAGCGRPHLRQYPEFADLQRQRVMLGLVAEGSRHAAAGRVEGFDVETGDQLQRRYRRVDRVERLLVTMPVQQCRPAFHRSERQSEAARGALAVDKFLKELRASGERL